MYAAAQYSLRLFAMDGTFYELSQAGAHRRLEFFVDPPGVEGTVRIEHRLDATLQREHGRV